MKLEHVAIWTNQLEALKNFYIRFLDGTPSEKYINAGNRFESYFLKFESGARLELMQKPDIPKNLNDSRHQYLGIIHLAFEVKSMAEVDQKADDFRQAGFPILKGPRKTGDGYYEFETLDPDSNRLEICSVWSD
jgi:lactoylglutathione lyase